MFNAISTGVAPSIHLPPVEVSEGPAFHRFSKDKFFIGEEI